MRPGTPVLGIHRYDPGPGPVNNMSSLSGTYTFQTSLPLMSSFTADVPVAAMVGEAVDAAEDRIVEKAATAAGIAAVVGGIVAGAIVAYFARR